MLVVAALGAVAACGRVGFDAVISDPPRDVRVILPERAERLVRYWRFDGDVRDDSVSAAHGTPTAVTFAEGVIEEAAELDGATSFIAMTLPDTERFTYAFWFLPKTETSSAPRFLETSNVRLFMRDFQRLQIEIAAATMRGVWKTPQEQAYLLDTWHHAVIVADASNDWGAGAPFENYVRFYVDGVRQTTVMEADPVGARSVATGPGLIGDSPALPATRHYNGRLDDFAVWSDVLLGDDEAVLLYTSQVAP